MSGASIDLNDFDIPSGKSSSQRAEIDRWLENLESLLADVADDPELAEPLARLIARTRASREAAAERTKRALSSLDSLLRDSRRSATGAALLPGD